MQYIKIIWSHNVPEDPILYYLEIDDEREEVRKIEIFSDGSASYASLETEVGTEILRVEKVPSIKDLNNRPDFRAFSIDPSEFEQLWAKVTRFK